MLRIKPSTTQASDNDQRLIEAAALGNSHQVREALALGADIHAHNDDALRLSAGNGHRDTVELLLDRGADIHVLSEEPLCLAARNARRDTVELLLDRGADIHAVIDRALHLAARNGQRETVELLLDRGADIHAENDWALRLAAEYGHMETVELLLDRVADIYAENDWSLRHAAANGHRETVKLLLDRGADVRAVNEVNDLALRLAIVRGHRETVMFLLRHGAAIPMTTGDGKDALDHSELAQWLAQLNQDMGKHFKSTTIRSRKHCFTANGVGPLHEHVLDACLTGQFPTLIAAPLIASTAQADRQLFQDIWDALPRYWQDRYSDLYVQFAKEGGIRPILGHYTSVAQENVNTQHAHPTKDRR